jgi:hypothetical protein
MFGLSYTVVVVTANTEVQSDGTLLSKGGTSVIANASAASKFNFGRNDNGQYCIPPEEMQTITEQVFSGRNVLVELGEFTENHKLVEQLQADGADINEATDVICFCQGGGGNRSMCLLPADEDCVAVDSHGHRKLSHGNGGWSPSTICSCYDPITNSLPSHCPSRATKTASSSYDNTNKSSDAGSMFFILE